MMEASPGVRRVSLLDSAIDDRDAGLLETARGTLLASTFTSLAYQDHMANPAKLLQKHFGDKTEEHSGPLADGG